MKKADDIIPNRTRQYLSPILHTFPTIWKAEHEKTNIICYSIMDALYYKTKKIEFRELLFVAFENNQKFINESRKIKGYVDEYPHDTQIYIVVFETPKEFTNAYRHFLVGKYNLMYSKRELQRLCIPQIHNGKINPTYLVLTKDKMGFKYYQAVIKEAFGVDVLEGTPDQYDIPPRIKKEVINFKNNIEFIKQITPLKVI